MDADDIFHAMFHLHRHKKEYKVGSAFIAGVVLQHVIHKRKNHKKK